MQGAGWRRNEQGLHCGSWHTKVVTRIFGPFRGRKDRESPKRAETARWVPEPLAWHFPAAGRRGKEHGFSTPTIPYRGHFIVPSKNHTSYLHLLIATCDRGNAAQLREHRGCSRPTSSRLTANLCGGEVTSELASALTAYGDTSHMAAARPLADLRGRSVTTHMQRRK